MVFPFPSIFFIHYCQLITYKIPMKGRAQKFKKALFQKFAQKNTVFKNIIC